MLTPRVKTGPILLVAVACAFVACGDTEVESSNENVVNVYNWARRPRTPVRGLLS